MLLNKQYVGIFIIFGTRAKGFYLILCIYLFRIPISYYINTYSPSGPHMYSVDDFLGSHKYDVHIKSQQSKQTNFM